jgi:hypothetical protein
LFIHGGEGALLRRDVHLGIAARRGRVHSGDNEFSVPAQSGPLLLADHDKCNSPPAFQVLLVTHVLVGREQNLEISILRSCYQLAISKSVPSAFNCLNNNVALQGFSSGAGVPLSKSMSIGHLGGRRGRRRVKTPRRKFDHRYNLFMRQMEPVHNLADRGAHFQIVKDNGNRRSRVPEHPCAAALAGNALYGGAL